MTDTAGQTGQPAAPAAPAAGTQPGQAPAGEPTATPGAPAPTPGTPAPQPGAQPQATPQQPGTPAPGTPAPGSEQQPGEPAAGQIPGVDTTGWPQSAIDAYKTRDQQAKGYQTEAGDRRVQLRDLIKQVAPGAGIEIPDDQPVDARALREQMTTEIAAERREAAVALAAAQHGVPADRLEYLAFKIARNTDAQALDTTAADFRASMSTIVQSEIQRDASLAGTGAQPQVASVPGVVGNGSGGAALTADAFKSMSMQERTNLYNTDRATYDRLAAESY